MIDYSIPANVQFVPVRFMNDAGSVSDTPPGRPVVKAVLRNDPNHGKSTLPVPTNSKIVYALLDTGADNNYATPAYIAAAACPQLGTSTVHGGTSSAPSTHYLAHIFFPELQLQIETDIFSAQLGNSPATEHMVIGMLSIVCGRLVLDFKQGIYRLYLG
ncbi:hypothetical protein ACSFEV_11835 [Pseudomonas fulva]|uniref:hypothetical protein n=1 Tax=Pseudomonas TaxID=286 RepID=UPI00370C5982